jgi:hypothetical protein
MFGLLDSSSFLLGIMVGQISRRNVVIGIESRLQNGTAALVEPPNKWAG